MPTVPSQAEFDALKAEVAALKAHTHDTAPLPPPPPTGSAFMSRPARAPVVISDATDVDLTGFSINGGTVSSPAGIGITLIRVKRAKVSFVDYQNLIGGIYLQDCEDVVIEDCRGRNIGNSTIGSGKSNYVQFAGCRGGAVRRCKFLGGQTEDMISTWHSGGWGVGRELIIEDNQLEGLIVATPEARIWNRTSGTGVILSDGAGDPKNGYVIVRRNKLLNVGQVPLQLIDGPGLQAYENVIYSERYSLNNAPITSWEGTPRGVVKDNRYRFIKGDGSEGAPWIHPGGSGLVLTNNVRDMALTPTSLKVVL